MNTQRPLWDWDSRTLSLLGPICPGDIHLLVDHFLRLDAESELPITLFISSQGGTIADALMAIDAMALLKSPIRAAALGIVEGAGLAILASASERILFSSVLLSTAGLWDLPRLHPSAQRSVGLMGRGSTGDILSDLLAQKVKVAVTQSEGKLPIFLSNPDSPIQVFNAEQAIDIGLADSIIHGSSRLLRKSKHNKNHVSNKTSTLSL